MSFYEESSIVITPNAYKAGTLYAVVPTSGLADMDVTRATAATRVDESGLVNYAEVLGGEEIVNGDFATNLDSWSTSSWWVWNALGAYHPSTSSHKPLYQEACEIGKTYLITFDLNCVGSSLAKVSLGPSTGSTTKTFATSLPTGSYSYVLTAEAEYLIFNRQNIAEFYVDNVSVKQVDRDNVPRIDYTGGGCPHILAEPQRTNLLTQSNQFDTTWVQSGTLTSGQDGVGGSTDAWKFQNPSSTSSLYQPDTTSGVQTLSAYFKKNSNYGVRFFAFGSVNCSAYFDLNNGAVVVEFSSTAKIETVGDDWFRCSMTFDQTNTRCDFYVTNNASTQVLGDYTIQYAQLEAGSYPTSYIPTSGATVTRNQDVFIRDGISSLINSTEGTLFVEMAALSELTDSRVISINNGTSSYYIWLNYTSASNTIRYVYGFLGTNYADLPTVVADTTLYSKIAVTWKLNEFKFFINGNKISEDLSGSVMPAGTLNKLEFNRANGSEKMNGKVKQLQVYPSALSDSELTTLTTP